MPYKFAHVEYLNKQRIRNTDELTDVSDPSSAIQPNNSATPVILGYKTYADVYIILKDEYNQLIEGNNDIVRYREYFNSEFSDVQEVRITGSTRCLIPGALIENTGTGYFYGIQTEGDVIENTGTYTPPGYPSVNIQTVIIDKIESNAGSKDAQITVKATSSAGALQYSLNDTDYQTTPVFTALSGGAYTAFVKDDTGYKTSLDFTIDTLNNLLVADPTVTIGNNTSRWSAAFNPVVFTYQRRDFNIVKILPSNFAQHTKFWINGTLSIQSDIVYTKLATKDLVYINAGAYQGTFEVYEVDYNANTITINKPYVEASSATGFVNIDKLRPYYHIKTQIKYQSQLTGAIETITATHRPDSSGLVKADISSFLQTLLRAADKSNFTQVNYRDHHLSACYQIGYSANYYNVVTGEDTPDNYIQIAQPYYITYAAQQLGSAYGGNMASYVPFKNVDGISRRASWITDFIEPSYSIGYPFDIGFIYSEHLAGLDLFYELTPLDINRKPLLNGTITSYLLNEDHSFLLNQDASKLVIRREAFNNEPTVQALAKQIGLNRLLINQDFADQAHFITLVLKYIDSQAVTRAVTKIQTIKIDRAIDEQSVYLRWIGLTGSWNYYRFIYNQEVSLDVQNAVIARNYISDWANQDAMDEVISKSAGAKMKVMAEDLSVNDIKGLQSIKYSPKVQMLTGKNPVKWQTIIVNTATFAEYETRQGQAPFSITFSLPALNIQTQ